MGYNHMKSTVGLVFEGCAEEKAAYLVVVDIGDLLFR